MTIGFIGLGNMGMKMAVNLLSAGFEVIGFNRSKSREVEFEKHGGLRVSSLVELGQMVDAIVTCLTDSSAVREIINGLLSGARPRFKLFIDCSTIGVAAAEEIGKMLLDKGIYYLDSPVSGGPQGARDGTLTIMVSGDENILNEQAMPIYKAMGKNIIYFGGNGSAQKIKLINQILSWVNHAVICEAAVLAKKAGLDMDKLYDCITNSYGNSRIFEVSYKSHIQPENYENPTGMKMLVKDLNLAQSFAASCNAYLPMTDASMILYRRAIADGFGDMDQSVIMEQLKL